jgi:WD40 repeat protein
MGNSVSSVDDGLWKGNWDAYPSPCLRRVWRRGNLAPEIIPVPVAGILLTKDPSGKLSILDGPVLDLDVKFLAIASGSLIVEVSSSSQVKLLDLYGNSLDSLRLVKGKDQIEANLTTIASTPLWNSRFVFFGTSTADVLCYDVKELRQSSYSMTFDSSLGSIRVIQVSGKGDFLVSFSSGFIYLVNSRSQKIERKYYIEETMGMILCMCWKPDGTHFAVGTSQGFIVIFDTIKEEPIKAQNLEQDVSQIQWSIPISQKNKEILVVQLADTCRFLDPRTLLPDSFTEEKYRINSALSHSFLLLLATGQDTNLEEGDEFCWPYLLLNTKQTLRVFHPVFSNLPEHSLLISNDFNFSGLIAFSECKSSSLITTVVDDLSSKHLWPLFCRFTAFDSPAVLLLCSNDEEKVIRLFLSQFNQAFQIVASFDLRSLFAATDPAAIPVVSSIVFEVQSGFGAIGFSNGAISILEFDHSSKSFTIRALPQSHVAKIICIELNTTLCRLASADEDGIVSIYDTTNDRVIMFEAFLSDDVADPVSSQFPITKLLKFSRNVTQPSKNVLYVGSSDSKMRMFDLDSGAMTGIMTSTIEHMLPSFSIRTVEDSILYQDSNLADTKVWMIEPVHQIGRPCVIQTDQVESPTGGSKLQQEKLFLLYGIGKRLRILDSEFQVVKEVCFPREIVSQSVVRHSSEPEEGCLTFAVVIVDCGRNVFVLSLMTLSIIHQTELPENIDRDWWYIFLGSTGNIFYTTTDGTIELRSMFSSEENVSFKMESPITELMNLKSVDFLEEEEVNRGSQGLFSKLVSGFQASVLDQCLFFCLTYFNISSMFTSGSVFKS